MSGRAGKRIENDEQYQKSLNWLITTSVELADPLLDGPEREKKQKIYDHVANLIQAYRRGELAQKFPGLRQIYAELGWNYDDHGPAQEQQPVQSPPEPPKQPEREQQTDRKTVNLSSWLDDD